MYKLTKIVGLTASLLYAVICFADDGVFTLNLKDAEIGSLIATVAQKTGKNFVVDPRVKGKVTIISNEKMSTDELYNVFLSILQVHGYAAVTVGNVVKILPDVSAKQGPVPLVSNTADLDDQLVTRVIPIKNIAASKLVPILRPLVPQQGHLAAYAESNIIVLTDRSSNISRLVDIIARIDLPDNDEIEFIKLQHASANEVVRILSSLQQKGGASSGVPNLPQFAADDRTNSILVSGNKAARIRIRALIVSLDSPLEQGGNTKVFYLKYAKAKEMSAILKGVNEGQKKTAGGNARAGGANDASREIDIQADEETNALIITAAPDAMRNIEAVIRQLDIRRAQVHVEAIIAEVSDNAVRELGFSYLFGNEGGVENDGSVRPIGAVSLGEGGVIMGSLAASGLSDDSSSVAVPSGFTTVFGDISNSGQIFAGIFRALKTNGQANILSTPNIVTLDNEEAEIIVGQNIPLVTGSFTTTGGGSDNPFQTVERQDVGTRLKIKPQINEGNTIQLEIEQESSSVDRSNAETNGLTTTNKREIKTNVLIDDGQILVLGGLVQERGDETVAKLPILGDIPLLGRLFQYRGSNKAKTNLMVFLRPTIIKDRTVADQVSQQKYSYMLSQQQGAGYRPSLFPVDFSLFPKIELYLRKPEPFTSLVGSDGS